MRDLELTRPVEWRWLARRPWLRAAAAFVSEPERAALAELADGELARAGEEIADGTGRAVELEIEHAPLLAAITARVAAAVELAGVVPPSVRFRRYEASEGHPPHPDHYELDGAALVVTAMLVLEAPVSGGATEFPEARPHPARVAPIARQLVTWTNVAPDGADDPLAVHRGAPVIAGRKEILLWFFYEPREAFAARALEAPRGEIAAPPPGTIFTCVDDGVPEITLRLLREACDAREVLFRAIDARAFRYQPSDRLPEGAMLYRASGSRAAQFVEEHLLREGIATLHASIDDAIFSCGAPQRQLERAGLVAPRWFPVATTERELLADFVERLGGFPVVVKVAGGEGGLGVMRADAMPALRALIDHLVRGEGRVPELSAYVPDAMHHRVIVVGDRAVATYENPIEAGDFRSAPADDAAAYSADVPPHLAAPAIAAVRALRLRFGGVDLLRHASGRVYVLEVNFPCFFAQATLGGGVDVAGAMLDWLVARAQASAPSDR